MHIVLTVLLMIAIGPAWAQSDDLTYKGVPLGASLEEYKAKLPDHRCYSAPTYTSCSFDFRECLNSKIKGQVVASTEETKACFARNSFGGLFAISANADFRDGKLTNIRFSFGSGSFDKLAEAVMERLGKPTKATDSTVQTRAGVELQNRQMIWERPSMIFTIAKYGGTIDKGYAVLTTPQERDRALAEHEASKRKGAKDF